MNLPNRGVVFILVAVALAWACPALAGEVVEKFDNGKIKVRYKTDTQNRKQGLYKEYYESGHTKIRATYKDDQLDGAFVETDDKGRLLKEQAYRNGFLLYPNSPRLIKATLDAILAGQPAPAAEPAAAASQASPEAYPGASPDNIKAMRQLNAYRFLAGVPYDVSLKAEYCDYAYAAADICDRLGTVNHNPPNPGMTKDEYEKARFGAGHSNLGVGRPRTSSTGVNIDGWVSDSGIPNLGHRRWCLNPAMGQAGFGAKNTGAAMYAHDGSRKVIPDYDYVAFPARGYMPISYFKAPSWWWSVSLNPAKYQAPIKKKIKVTVCPLAPGAAVDLQRKGPPMDLDVLDVDLGPFGIPNCIMFHPAKAVVENGARYWVEITGLKKADGTDAKVEYFVEFLQL